jgi:hypothetical protein
MIETTFRVKVLFLSDDFWVFHANISVLLFLVDFTFQSSMIHDH